MRDDEIDEILLANITSKWRKMAFVIGATMGQIDASKRAGRNDLYFAERIAFLLGENLIESQGDLSQMRECEIRLLGR
jgi:hypothetical protein